MKNLLSLCFIVYISTFISYGQDNLKLCKAVAKGNFDKVERIVKRKIKNLPEGVEVEGSVPGYQQMEINIDSLTSWFKRASCVEDAFSDKCQIKIMIYPGWSIVGVKFITNSGIEEKCFSIQKGTMGTINIFGWHPKISRAKAKLVYKKMYNCKGFVEEQRRNCVPSK